MLNNLVFVDFSFANSNKVLRKLFGWNGGKFENKFSKNVSKINFRNNQLPIFTFSTFFFYMHKAYKRIEAEI